MKKYILLIIFSDHSSIINDSDNVLQDEVSLKKSKVTAEFLNQELSLLEIHRKLAAILHNNSTCLDEVSSQCSEVITKLPFARINCFLFY